MAILKCKMCGGTIEFTEGATVGVCDSCGTKQTLPNANDEVIANLHNRATTLRLKSEFDKAEEIYNKILEKHPTDAEAHWGIILCRYGIEYVEDPTTYTRVPTCHRASFEAVLADEDYKLAIENGDMAQRQIYEAEAKEIDRIQKEILAIAQNEKPFDIFICYKETDENGKRTQDSVIANDIYYQLTQEGFKVFYAAITLEDKLGQEYEPYIFAALNSAKVMLVVGSKPEYFSAVWVKNEWSRFLKLMKKQRDKLLIPCYKDMDAYELPEEFAHLQAQDMGKIGFINDIVRGIKKVVADSKPEPTKETVVINNTANANIEPLLKRAFMFLEDGEWEKADDFCEQVLNQDPENAEAYLGKLMAEYKIKKQDSLKDCKVPFDGSNNFQKACRFDSSLAEMLNSALVFIKERNENERIEKIYQDAISQMNDAEYQKAIDLFSQIKDYKDTKEQLEICIQKIEDIKAKTEAERMEAERKAEENRIAKAEKKAKKKKKAIISIVSVLLAIVIVFVSLYMAYSSKYDIKKLNGCKSISAGFGYIVGLKTDGTVVAVGKNYEGQCNVSDWTDIVAISAGFLHTVGLKSDGTVVAVGKNDDGQCNVSDWTDIVAIFTSNNSTFGLKSDGTVVAVGDNGVGQCDVSEWTDIVAISAGNFHTVGLKSDGTVVAVGDNDDGQCDVSDWTDIVAIFTSYDSTFGLKSDGTVVAVGSNDEGQCDVSEWTDIVAISAGYFHTVGLKSDGTVVAVGDNDDGQCNVSDWTDIVAIFTSRDSTFGLKSDGTVVAVGKNYDGQCNVSDWNDIVALSSEYWYTGYTVGLKSDGTVLFAGKFKKPFFEFGWLDDLFD